MGAHPDRRLPERYFYHRLAGSADPNRKSCDLDSLVTGQFRGLLLLDGDNVDSRLILMSWFPKSRQRFQNDYADVVINDQNYFVTFALTSAVAFSLILRRKSRLLHILQ